MEAYNSHLFLQIRSIKNHFIAFHQTLLSLSAEAFIPHDYFASWQPPRHVFLCARMQASPPHLTSSKMKRNPKWYTQKFEFLVWWSSAFRVDLSSPLEHLSQHQQWWGKKKRNCLNWIAKALKGFLHMGSSAGHGAPGPDWALRLDCQADWLDRLIKSRDSLVSLLAATSLRVRWY